MSKKTIKTVEQSLKFAQEQLKRAETERDRERITRLAAQDETRIQRLRTICDMVKICRLPDTAFLCGTVIVDGAPWTVSLNMSDLRLLVDAVKRKYF